MPLQTAEALWDNLNTAGRLSPKSHDRKFFDDLREELNIAPGADIGAHLRANKTKPTPFLIAVLNALQPFSMMFSDIYEMFAEGGVKHSNDNILIQFDFGQAGKLNFDANDFRTALRTLEKLNSAVSRHAFKPGDLNSIYKGIMNALICAHQADAATIGPLSSPIIGTRNGLSVKPNDAIANAVATEWMEDASGWPYMTPPPLPQWPDDDSLGKALAPFSNAIEQLCFRTGRYASQTDLRKNRSTKTPQTDKRAPISLWSEDLLAWVQDDHPARFFYMRALWHCYELAPKDSQTRADLAAEIRALIKKHSDVDEEQLLAQELCDLLDLPVWQQRSQLYSVWLITVLKRELKSDERFELQGDNGRLDFAFSPTHIADLHIGHDVLKLVAEFRASADGVVLAGEGRMQNIQPDYSLIQSAPGAAPRVIYVLEAKQYAQGKTKNFNDALRDYASVHTHALVALANYGAIPASQPAKLIKMCEELGEENVSERCKAFAEVNPAEPVAMSDVREHFRLALTDYSWPLPLLVVDVSSSMSEVLDSLARLGWDEISGLIADSGMRVALALPQPIHFQPGEPARAAMHSLFDEAVYGPLSLYDIAMHERPPLILFTDSGGFLETLPYHRKLAGVIILQPDCSLILRMNQESEHLLRRALPRLIAKTFVGESY